MQSSIGLVLDVMQSEKSARGGKSTAVADDQAKRAGPAGKAKTRAAPKKKAAARKRKRAPTAARRTRS